MTRKALMVAVAALLALAGTANATVWQLRYDSITNGNPGGTPSPANTPLGGSWTYDDVTGDIVGTGSWVHDFDFSGNDVFQHNLTDLTISGAGVPSAASYSCDNGFFGDFVLGRQLCAGYNYGDNNTNDSTVAADGVTVITLGGDDFLQGEPQTLANIFSLDQVLVDGIEDGPVSLGSTLIVHETGYDPTVAGAFEMTFTVVPVPAAVWLFGSALGLLGWVRRRQAA